MKLCICVSGQIRDNTEEPTKALQNLISDLEDKGNEVTLIFSIWEKISRKLDGVINIKQLKKIFTPDLVNLISPNWYGKKLWLHLPNTFINVKKDEAKNAYEWVQNVFPKAIIDCESDDVLDLKFDQMTTTDNNSRKMLYKIWRANEVKRKIEKDSGIKFDFVIRVRPDYGIKKINLNIDNNTIYIPSVLDNFANLEDTFAIGSSEAIDYYCELFAKSILPSVFKWRGIHAMLAEHFNKQPFPEPIYNIKNAQKNGFVFKHMMQNTNKLDIGDLKADLTSDFFQGLFEIIKLKRSTNSTTDLSLLNEMEALFKHCQGEDNQITFFILLQDICISQSSYTAALKALLMADFNYLSLNPKKIKWNHRFSYLFNQIGALLNELDWVYSNKLISQLLDKKTHPFIDQLFENIDKAEILNNLDLLATSNKGSEILNKTDIKLA